MPTSPTREQDGLRWTLDELGQRVATALALSQVGQSNGQIREVPGRRTLRYYTTLGLLDRPAEMRGRTALYCGRHLEQVVAIKRLQAEGLPLKDVQERLAGLGVAEVAALAEVPAEAYREGEGAAALLVEPGPARRDLDFWAAAPVEPADVPVEVHAPLAPEGETSAHSDEEGPVQLALPGVLPAVGLADSVTLLLHPPRPLDEGDLEAIRLAAAPLLDVLQQRGLLAIRAGIPSSQGGSR